MYTPHCKAERTRVVKQLPKSTPRPKGAHAPLSPDLRLPRMLGNQGYGQFLQTKLKIGSTNDPLEREAHRVADEVMRLQRAPRAAALPFYMQRQLGDEGERDQVWLKPLAGAGTPPLRRQVDDEEEELLQAAPLIQRRISAGEREEEAPAIVHKVLRSPGRPLDPSTRVFMESRFGYDFSQVRVHVNEQAAASARAINARAYTVGRDVVFGSGEYMPTANSGQQLIAHELTHVVQQDSAEPSPGIQRVPLPEVPAVEEVPVAQKTDSELVHGIIGTQDAILEGWKAALLNFDKVLTSASDKSTKPNFKAVMVSFFEDKLMSEMISRSKVTGAGDAFALLGKLEAEVKRAAQAKESATLRDFIIQHRTAVGRLQQAVKSLIDDFLARVRLTKKRAIEEGSAEAESEYGLMRLHLVEMLEQLDFRLSISSPEDLFEVLSEEWIRQTTIPGPMGTRFPGFILIRIEDDFTIRNAEIKGPGGQKIAEQLLKDSPGGVDVFDMKVPRRILYYRKGKSLHRAIVRLDENNNLTNEGSYVEGHYTPIYRRLMHGGLPPTKDLSGD